MINAANIAVGYHCRTVIHLYNGSQNRCRQKAIQPLQRFQPFETSLMRLLQAHLQLDLLQGIAERMACGHVDGHTPKQSRHIRYRQRFARSGGIRQWRQRHVCMVGRCTRAAAITGAGVRAFCGDHIACGMR